MSVPIKAIAVGQHYSDGRRVRKVLKIEMKDGAKKVQYQSRDQKAGSDFTIPYWVTIEHFARDVDKRVEPDYGKDSDRS
jgi:hypothetical protein